MNIITQVWRREPVAIVTVLGTTLLAVIQATTSPQGWSWQSISIAAIGAIMGLVSRENVYSPHTVDKLASESSKEALDTNPTTPHVEP